MSVICDDLRAAILQAAMTGKLTEQLDSDDDSEIIKNEILNERSAYKECKFLENIEDDVAFPDTWQYLRAGEVFELTTGDKILKGDKMPLMDAKYFRGKQTSYTDKGNLANSGDVLILVDGENSGEVFLCSESGYMGSTFKKLFIPKCINKDFALYFLEMNRRELRENKRGAAIPHLDKKVFFNFILPIPPLAEQKRIVGKIDELMARVADLEKSADALASLKKSFPSDARDALLQAAMQGKLTEQLPEDGDAEELLEQIRAEKEKLVAKGAIKKKKRLTPAEDREVPFDIPENWKWQKFGDIVDFDMGKTPPRSESIYWGGDIPWVSIADMPKDGILLKTKEKITAKAMKEKFGSKIVPKGTLIMSFKLTVGRCSILGIDAVHNEAIISIKPIVDKENVFRDYLSRVLSFLSNYGDTKDAIKGKTLNSDSLNNLLIPLPPLAEQKRIVERIDSLLSNINMVEKLIASE